MGACINCNPWCRWAVRCISKKEYENLYLEKLMNTLASTKVIKDGGRIRWTQERKTSTWRYWPTSLRGGCRTSKWGAQWFHESLESGSDDNRTQVEVAIKTSLISRSFGSTLQWNRKSLSWLFFFFYWILKTDFNIQKKRRKRVQGVPVTASGWSQLPVLTILITWLFNLFRFRFNCSFMVCLPYSTLS